MALVRDLPEADIRSRLRHGLLGLRVGPYNFKLQCNFVRVAKTIQTLYRDFPVAEQNELTDFTVALAHRRFLSRLRGQADFYFDNQPTFGPFPAIQACAFLEWGLNWCVSIHANEFLKLHAATIARKDSALIMPGIPGAGKSTLCAALGLTGWRILSDEHALIPPGTSKVVPLCRPVSLKNESIGLIKSFDSRAIFGPTSKDTHKGEVAHMKADLTADSHDTSPVPVRAMVFPKYTREEPQRISPRRRTDSFILAAYHSFNYSLMGEAGFHAMTNLVDGIACFDLTYHDLEWAIRTVEDLHDQVHAL